MVNRESSLSGRHLASYRVPAMNSRLLLPTLVTAVLSAGLPAAAQTPPGRYVCNLRTAAGERLTLEFVHDTVGERAFIIANNGTGSVAPISGSAVVTFLEILPTGAVQTTTIAHDGEAVHSRHTFNVFSGEFIPSQYTGTCS